MNNIKKGMEIKGGKVEIPDTNRGDLPEFFVEQGYKVGAEIGVYKGDYTKQFLDVGLKMYAIDPWIVYNDYDERRGKFQHKQDVLYKEAFEKLSPYPNCTIIRKMSMDAVKDFEDGSLDFVYIDAHHGFRHVADDIWEWSQKVRKGGIVSGHDYGILMHEKPMKDPYNNHVRYVVDAYTEALKIKDWYVLGRKVKLTDDEKKDIWRSWFWIKE